MNGKIILYVLLIIIGAVCTLLSGWVYLLEFHTRSLLFALLGILAVVAGIVNIRRERQA
jgi:hypothetical protein